MSNIKESSTIQYSETFPVGYGDLTLQSGDGEFFHFSSFLLAYSSPVFKDMLELARTTISGHTQHSSHPHQHEPAVKSEPVVLTEDAVTVCGLLLHVDPSKMPFPLSKATVGRLLEAGRKYQLPTILQWFAREVTTVEISQSNPENQQPLIEEVPLFVLSLSVEYEIKELIPKAVLASINGGPIEESDSLVDIKYYRLVHCLRQKRIEKYLKLLQELSASDNEEEWEVDQDGDWQRVAPMVHECSCGTTLGSWIITVTQSILQKPRWSCFMAAIEPHKRCSSGWSTRFWLQVGRRTELYKEEQTLPQLP